MKRARHHLIGLSLALLAASPALAQTQMASVRELYASASYEEALNLLASVGNGDEAAAIEAEQYRALCLLAIGREGEARASIRRIVEKDPLYVPETDASPRISTVFTDLRRELLPAIARQEFAEGKSLFGQQQYGRAAELLERVVKITADPAVRELAGVEDLRLVADGLLTLARAKTPPAAPPARPEAPPPARAAAPPAPIIYGADDPTVSVPEPVSQPMPPWRAPQNAYNGLVLSGLLRLIIDESGAVEKATLLRALHPTYDAALVKAAESWKFTPALREGQPVKYAKVIRVELRE